MMSFTLTVPVHPAPRSLVALLGVALASGASAQSLRDLPSRHFDVRPGVHRHAADLDRDGDIDLIATDGVGVQVFENLGQLRFAEGGSRGIPRRTNEHLALLDLNADGLLDVLLATGTSARPSLSAYVRVGGLYRDETWRVPADVTPVVLLTGDADRDGDQDLIVVDGPRSTLSVLRNDGTGRFSAAATSQPLVDPRRGWAADLNGDRAVDLVLALGNQVVVMLNDGQGRFAAAALPMSAVTDLVFGDFDRDGDVDLAATASGAAAPLYLFDNDGAGRFSSQPQRLPTPRDTGAHGLSAFDADNDGDTDLVLGTSSFNSELLLNTGGAMTRPAAARVPLTLTVGQMLPADLNGDRAVDLIVDTSTGTEIWMNVGGRLVSVDPPALPASAQAFADLNGDGDPDMLGLGFQQLFTARNDGSGHTAVDQVIALSRPADLVLTGDLDGDRDNDALLFVGRGSTNGAWQAFLNDGRGRLSAGAAFVVGASSQEDGVLVDLDADGDADLLRRDGSALESVAGGWVARPFAATAATVARPTAVDVDGDRLPEVFLSVPGAVVAFANRGGFAVSRVNLFASNPGTASHIVPTRAGDGVLRLWTVAQDWLGGNVSIHAFDGALFQLAGNLRVVSPVHDLRVVVPYGHSGPHGLVTFGGNGPSFTRVFDSALADVTATTLTGEPGLLVDVVDLDRNGHVDVIGSLGAWWNGERAHAPFGALLGCDYTVEFAPQPAIAVLVGTRSTQIVTPFGVLRVDPATAVALPVSGSTAEIHFSVPPVAASRGLEIVVQALDATRQLTNLERRVVR